MNVDVLKAGHHGSCNGISTRLLDLTTPTYVTMGVSSTNTYGHVHTQTKTLLSGRSIPWYRTDENGRITITSPGTVGGGYTTSYVRGSASMNGSADATSADSSCNSL
jgi:competence protein ComEC